MKNILKMFVIVAVATATMFAQSTNSVISTNTSSGGKSEEQGWEFTIGGSGFTIDGRSQFAFDFSVETNPFKPLPNLWVGMLQSFSWDPKLAGSTDLIVEWSWHVWKNLYFNTGWQGGIVYSNYDEDQTYWRHGPEITFQYFIGDNAFIYSGINYDFNNRDIEDGFRYSMGIGLAF